MVMMYTVDDILRGVLKLKQPIHGPRVNVDTILLAHFTRLKKGERAIELGSATGCVSLLIAKRVGDCSVEGIDIQSELVEMSNENSVANGLEHMVRFSHLDYREIRKHYPPEAFSVVTVNPPYDPPSSSRRPIQHSHAAARIEENGTLDDVFKTAAYLLGNKGRLYMVMRARRLVEMLKIARETRLEPKRIRFAHPSNGTLASVVLAEFVRCAGIGVEVESPLFMYGKDGEYTPDLLEAYWGRS